MSVVQLPPEILRTGHPAPVSVRDATGHLLLAKGVMVETEEQRKRLISRALYVDELEGDLLKRALAGKLDSMLRRNAPLGQMARAQADGVVMSATAAVAKPSTDPATAWARLQMHGRVLLQDPAPADFLARLHKYQAEVLELIEADADLALLILVQATTNDAHHYSVTHGLLVAVLCELAGRQLPGFTAPWLGSLASQEPALQLARLLQRADIFSARLSMRRARPAMVASAAVKAAYLDERQQADEAGKALIQTTGIYPPGSYVRLGSGEVAVVLRQGPHAKAPRVASIISKSGTPLVEPAVRDTRLRPHDVTGGVAPHDVKVRLNMEKLLRLA